ncbi:copper chaperone PCu(A)C [Rhodococcus sp. ABRD24]|uniref:copper chaperone PCu(A)C n=1 Tax=Rhodococcus sp. ABRD24 TaxID=2507582 RepID=UPI00103FF8FF|nr:copper chaperone PCu(A)C [Rhodococcus sp. ABRD24]QBJ97405.1 copper chaperone PCu(A)C [Rhodococcus sp. ABRD24]
MKAFTRARVLAIGVTVAAGLTLAGCSSDSGDSSDSKKTDTAAITLQDSWVKAADSGMTAMFGTIVNDSDSDITLTKVTTTVSPRVELHEMAPDGTGAMKMREKDGGVTVAANSTYELKPGADHIMLFDLPAPVQAGTDVPFTFEFADGATAQFTAQVRDFTGVREEYSGGDHGAAPTGAPNHGAAPAGAPHMGNADAHNG